MPAKPSGEIITRTVKCPQKNGDIYLLERKTIYDPDKKYNQVLSTKLIAKIQKGSDKPVATRPKKEKSKRELEKNEIIEASRDHIGMMEIINHIGEISGIDGCIYRNTDLGLGQKIISIARYLLASNGQSLPGILAWQFNHPLPYEDGISEAIYHEVFAKVGHDETMQLKFFANRCARNRRER